MSYNRVKTFPVDLTVTIFEYFQDEQPAEDEEVRYDWRASNGESSQETFESAEEAEEDARSTFS